MRKAVATPADSSGVRKVAAGGSSRGLGGRGSGSAIRRVGDRRRTLLLVATFTTARARARGGGALRKIVYDTAWGQSRERCSSE